MNELQLFIITSVRAACPTYHQTVFYDLQNYLHQTHVLRRSYAPEKMGINKK
jgi:phosphoribosylaminoimidazole carboxylase (NCAIR synthetase)